LISDVFSTIVFFQCFPYSWVPNRLLLLIHLHLHHLLLSLRATRQVSLSHDHMLSGFRSNRSLADANSCHGVNLRHTCAMFLQGKSRHAALGALKRTAATTAPAAVAGSSAEIAPPAQEAMAPSPHSNLNLEAFPSCDLFSLGAPFPPEKQPWVGAGEGGD
jgi:hypothetical protein